MAHNTSRCLASIIMAQIEYQYEPIDLARDAIRLIRILRGNYNQPLRCELFQSYLNPADGVPYEALSYTWGDHKIARVPLDIVNENKSIACLWILPNLHSILQHLRHIDRDRNVWVDAICINQAENGERSHQVRQMQQVYKGAESLIVWLGDFPVTGSGDPDHNGLFLLANFANQLASLTSATVEFKLDLFDRWEWHFNELMRLRGYQMPSRTSCRVLDASKFQYRHMFRALERLLRAPWFKRVWIIQEIASAKSGVILCSQKGRTVSIPVPAFAILPSLMAKTGLKTPSHTQAILDIMPVEGPRRRGWWTDRHDLEMLLVKFRDSESTEPRDFIYALLGISSDAFILAKQGILQPNYKLPQSEVFRNTACYLLFSGIAQYPDIRLPDCKETLIWALADPDGFSNGVLKWAYERRYYDTVLHLLHRCDIGINRWEGETLLVDLMQRFSRSQGLPFGNFFYRGGENLSPTEHCMLKIIRSMVARRHIVLNTCIQASLLQLAGCRGGGEVSWLLETRSDIDVNSQDSYGRTALTALRELEYIRDNSRSTLLGPISREMMRPRFATRNQSMALSNLGGIDSGIEMLSRHGANEPASLEIPCFGLTHDTQFFEELHRQWDSGNIRYRSRRTFFLVRTPTRPGVHQESMDPLPQRAADLRLHQNNAQIDNFKDLETTLLGMAIVNGDVGLARLFLQQDSSHVVKKALSNPSLLAFAASHGGIDIRDLLLQTSASETAWPSGAVYEALHWAVLKGDTEVFKQFWNFSRGPVDEFGNLAWGGQFLTLAAANRNLGIVEHILVGGDDDNVSEQVGTFLCGNHYNAPRMTPLKIAALIGDARLVGRILASATDNIDLEAGGKDCCGTPLWAAVSQNHVGVVKELLSHGAEIEAKGFHLGHYNNNIHWDQMASTPLWEAVHRGHADMVKLLLSSGANDELFGPRWEQVYYNAGSSFTQIGRTIELFGQARRRRDGGVCC